MRLNLLRIFQISDKVEYNWRQEDSISFVTVEYRCWMPWPPTPKNISIFKEKVEVVIDNFKCSDCYTGQLLEKGIGRVIQNNLGRKAGVSVRFGPRTAKPKS